ncbi:MULTISPECIES: dephospho-CoA kinase [unclassified Ligilactobacillus]|uniref:dephospho-CoA kinase n=1 Tax=unclassified Ligilactobacillus TaxID=2767920 RepID=UPI00385371C8
MTYVLGLTGGIASGKSTVSALFRQLGIPVIDADQVARNVVAPATSGLERIKMVFGAEMVTANGQLDRARLGNLIFAHPQDRQRLDAIIAPLIRRQITAQLVSAQKHRKAMVVLDAPLLIEQHYGELCDGIMVVSVTPPTQLKRLILRDHLSVQAARQRIAAQISDSERQRFATVVVDNNGEVEATRRQVIEWLQTNGWEELASKRGESR